MEPNSTSVLRNRREFIRQAACAAVGTVAMSSAIRDFRYMNAAVAQSNILDYKALVCIFLAGGNDSNNLIIPTIQGEYDNYATLRTPVLAIPQSAILNLDNGYAPLNSDGHNYGLHPCCVELRTLFGEGKLAALFNTGTLVYPITAAQYKSGGMFVPPQLFSHADQVTQWQTSIPDRAPLTGWGGRCADLLNSVQPSAQVSLSLSVAGANTFEVGNIVSQYSVTSTGGIALTLPNANTIAYTNRQSALTNILGQNYTNLQAQAYAKVARHSIDTTALLNNAIANTQQPPTGTWNWNVPFPGTVTVPTNMSTFASTNLGPQLKIVARLIEAAQRPAPGGLGMKRQIFFCSVGGYDLHTGQTPGAGNTTVGSHANLIAEISQCMYAFQRAMEQLNSLYPGISNKVTTFTASDFNRTLPSNGDGSDHGWGSHHLIMGGAVNGRRTYGRFPTLAVGGPDDTNTGRWIPSTACDQYFATLATWFGVDAGNLATVFPNLGRFSTSNLGFV